LLFRTCSSREPRAPRWPRIVWYPASPIQDSLVSGEPYQGFFQGVTIPANGPIVTTRVATEAPGNLVAVEGQAIYQGGLSNAKLAGLNPEAVIGQGWFETDEDAEEAISIAMAK